MSDSVAVPVTVGTVLKGVVVDYQGEDLVAITIAETGVTVPAQASGLVIPPGNERAVRERRWDALMASQGRVDAVVLGWHQGLAQVLLRDDHGHVIDADAVELGIATPLGISLRSDVKGHKELIQAVMVAARRSAGLWADKDVAEATWETVGSQMPPGAMDRIRPAWFEDHPILTLCMIGVVVIALWVRAQSMRVATAGAEASEEERGKIRKTLEWVMRAHGQFILPRPPVAQSQDPLDQREETGAEAGPQKGKQ
ncbi:MAG: hypothetical protein PF961_10595 [Planctomycetota bacterium]|jgi:hypothetical protein|nr:hypothetical protein [Planctomycetota bacterium]